MIYEKIFDNQEVLDNYLLAGHLLESPSITYLQEEPKIYTKPTDHSDEYLTTVALQDTTFSFNIYKSITPTQLESISYSLDDGKTWTTTENTTGRTADLVITTPTIEAGKHVLWKGNGTNISVVAWDQTTASGSEVTATQYFSRFSSTGNFNVRGNIMSIIYGDNFSRSSSIIYAGQFAGLFKGCSKLKSAKDLFIGKGEMRGNYSHSFMFYGCSALTDIPNNINDLEFNQNQIGQFRAIFAYCSSLTNDAVYNTMPTLKSTISDHCYEYMFYQCTGITSVPDNFITANYVKQYCYRGTFQNTHLASIPANILNNVTDLSGATQCYAALFAYTSITSIPETLLPATTLAPNCYHSMFYTCTNLTTIPEGLLPATDLTGADYCYYYMFSRCSNITSIPETLLPATILAPYCYAYMFSDCSNFTTIPEGLLPAIDLTGAHHCYQHMFAGSVSGTTVYSNKITTIPEGLLPATILAPSCYDAMFYDCKELTTIPAGLLPATDLTGAELCYSYMFAGQLYNSNKNNVTNKIASLPVGLLPATTLSTRCYWCMFDGCRNLTTIPSNFLPATNLTTGTGTSYTVITATTVGGTYGYMFRNCTKISTLQSDIIAATILSTACFAYMFNGCTGLTSLPGNFFKAQTMAALCYVSMFRGCTNASFTTLPENLFDSQTRVLTNSCYREMFYGCTKLRTLPKKLLKSKIVKDACYMDMFNSCSELRTICDFPATRAESTSNYRNMFLSCQYITGIPGISLNNVGTNACYAMFDRNANSAPNANVTLSDVSNVILHPSNVVGASYQNFLFYQSKIQRFPNIRCNYTSGNVQQSFESAFAGGSKCYNSTANYAGFVPLTRIYNYGVRYMFRYDSGLLYIKHAATTVNNNNSADNWLQGVNNTKRDYVPAFIMRPTNSHSNINNDTPSQWIVNQGLPVTTTVDGVSTTTKYESVIFQKSYPADLVEPVQIINSSAVSNVQELKIDEVTQASVTQTYLFTPVMNPDTGAQVSTWHTVKLSLTDNTAVPNSLLAGVLFPRLILGYNVTSIGNNAFDGNTELQFVLTGFKIQSIGNYAFRNCTSLYKIDLTDGLNANEPGLQTIGQYAFNNCTSLRSIILRNELTTIGAHAFEGSGLENVDIGSGLTSIGDYAFAGCYNLREIMFRSTIPSIGTNAFPVSDQDHEVSFTFTFLAAMNIPSNALTNITGLTQLNLGWNSSNQIGSIADNAFNGCTNIEEIFIDNTTPPTITANSFNGINNTFKIFVPGSAVQTYKTASVWSNYADRIFGT